MILEPGAFRVSDYRKAIPARVQKIALVNLILQMQNEGRQLALTPTEFVDSLRFDHRPPLQDRPYDTEKGDFDPPQNDPAHIEAICSKEHDWRTFGRKADAEKTATTVGSDVHNRAHSRRIRDREQRHQLKMEMKRGDPQAIARILGVERKPKPKRQWPKRPFPRRKQAAA